MMLSKRYVREDGHPGNYLKMDCRLRENDEPDQTDNVNGFPAFVTDE
jgi:hypothetical protein